jgi:hypothetical protein
MSKYVKKSKKTDPSYRRKSSSKHTPVERFLRFQVTHPENSGEVSHYIDIAKELSKINRRLYRQGMVYRIANISITSRDTINGLVSFSTAPDTWVTRNAWNRGFEMWNKMNQQVLDNQPGRKSRFSDYKVFLSNTHRTNYHASPQVRLPGIIDNGNNAVKDGEWEYCEYVSPDGTTSTDKFNAHIVGDHNGSSGNWTSISLIKSYGEARATVPLDTPLMDSQGDDDPLLNLMDDGSQVDEIASDLDTDGDLPPYAIGSGSTVGENYPGSSLNCPKPVVRRLASIGTADSVGLAADKGIAAPTVMLPGFDAICGLIEIETQSQNKDLANFRTDPDIFDVVIELAPGSYKGVAAFDI